jgi:zinc and cadmium transporter
MPVAQMVVWWYALSSVIVVSLLSLVGLAVISLSDERLRKAIFVMVALAAGGLFGDTFLELLPESYRSSPDQSGPLVLIGLFVFFVLERFLMWTHAHDVERPRQIRPVGYMNLTADAIHNFTDGMIIGASWMVNVHIGMTTTMAVVLHEIPHEMGNFFVLIYAGFSKGNALFYNFLSAVAAILGTIVVLTIGSTVRSFAGAMLPFAAGGFIYIAGSDLIPELIREPGVKKSVIQLAAMATGAGLILLTNLVG